MVLVTGLESGDGVTRVCGCACAECRCGSERIDAAEARVSELSAALGVAEANYDGLLDAVEWEFADELSDHCSGDGGPCQCAIHDALRDRAEARRVLPIEERSE
jgi:hypothetical protein